MAEELIGQLGYLGIALVLVLGGLGLPVPEEAPIIVAAVLSKNDKMYWPFALASCFVGVLLGDFLVYGLAYFYGEKVLNLRLTQKLLTREREAQIKGYFDRHGIKILILGRFAPGFRTAAYLTAGILKLPPLRLFLTDLFAATLSTTLMFGLGYVFAHQIQSGFDRVKHWLTVIAGVTLATWLLYRFYKARQRAGKPIGPPVLVRSDVPLPPDDLHARHDDSRSSSGITPAPASATILQSSNAPSPAEPPPTISPPVQPSIPVELDSGPPPPLESHRL